MNRGNGADQALFKIGLHIKSARKKQNLTLSDLARRAGLSKGLLSKIENYRTLPSLPVLTVIARSLRLDLADLVQGVCREPPAFFRLVKVGERTACAREKSRGFKYAALVSRLFGEVGFESFVLTLAPGARRKPVTTDGDEFLFMLKGQIEFMLGRRNIKLTAGDALYFDGRVAHVPVNESEGEAELLVVCILRNND